MTSPAEPLYAGTMARRSPLWLVLGALLGLASAGRAQDTAPPRFADVTLRLITTGDRQPLKEVGSFTSTLPLGKAGGLHRTLTVTNETRQASTSLELQLTVTPTLDDGGLLHCVVLSDVTPPGAQAVSRAKDMIFTHPGQQLMELFADPATGTHVSVAVAASLAAHLSRPASPLPPILFFVKVEQMCGAQRDELENLQLQSLDGKPVSHDYSRRSPRWVEGAPSGEEEQPLDKLPSLDFSKGTPVVKAGEGFSIPLPPDASGRPEEKKGDKPAVGPDGKAAEPPPKKIVWDQEFYHLTLEPLAMDGDRLVLRASVKGQILDPVSKAPLPPVDLKAEKTLLSGQPVPFYLTRDVAGGTQGYVVWVIPRWAGPAPPPPAGAPGSPAPPPP